MTSLCLRTTALALTVSVLTMGAAAGANAKEVSSNTVKLSQERLADLGYFIGPVDGRMGELTRNAIMDFQSRNGLVVSGELTRETYQLLKAQDFAAIHGGYYAANGYNAYNWNGYNPGYNRYSTAYNGYVYNGYGYVPATYNNGAPVNNWSTAQVQNVPIRFGALAINEQMHDGVRNYSVTLNGQPVLQANNQPQVLRVSHTYALNGEDAVIFTAVDGTGGCQYRNYLLTVRANGTYVAPQAIGNCSGAYQAQVDKNMLYISFPSNDMASLTDTWRYGDNALMHI